MFSTMVLQRKWDWRHLTVMLWLMLQNKAGVYFVHSKKRPAGKNARAKLVACFYAVRQGMMHVYLALKNGILDKTLQNNNVVFLQQ